MIKLALGGSLHLGHGFWAADNVDSFIDRKSKFFVLRVFRLLRMQRDYGDGNSSRVCQEIKRGSIDSTVNIYIKELPSDFIRSNSTNNDANGINTCHF